MKRIFLLITFLFITFFSCGQTQYYKVLNISPGVCFTIIDIPNTTSEVALVFPHPEEKTITSIPLGSLSEGISEFKAIRKELSNDYFSEGRSIYVKGRKFISIKNQYYERCFLFTDKHDIKYVVTEYEMEKIIKKLEKLQTKLYSK
jgi:hypothetical protein